jgi:tight adherence protein B
MEFVIAILAFISGMSFIMGAYYILTAPKNMVLARLERFTQSRTSFSNAEDKEGNKEKFKLKNILTLLGRAFATRGFTKKIEQELLKADYPIRAEEFLVFNIIMALTGAFVGFTIGRIGPALVFGLIGALFPILVVKKKKKQRFESLNNEIGDCLTVMSNSLRAGYSFHQAMDLVAKEMAGPLAKEFKKTLREISLGVPTEQALLNLTGRVESDDLDLMISAVLIQRQVGGNLAEVLDNISHTLRERIRIKGEIKTLTAQGRISGLIIGLLPPILFAILMVINPGYVGILIQTPIGIMLLMAGVVSEIIGVMFIKKIVDIEV